MSEYIKREDALRQVMMVETRENMYRCMKNIPAADVRPVVLGKWIVKTDADGKTYGVCSECGYEQYAGHLKFCHNCGSDMREES